MNVSIHSVGRSEMERRRPRRFPARASTAGTAAFLGVALLVAGCGRGSKPDQAQKQVVQNAGSDTIVNVAQAWAEAYAAVEPVVSVEVSGGGSGTGIAALINGTVDIANASRQMESNELARAVQNTGQQPRGFTVGYDALAIYVHKNNPLEEISLEQLALMFGEGGPTTKWSQLGVSVPGCDSDEIILISRQNNSGTYHYFREHVLQKKDFKLGTKDMHGSKDVVELIAKTPCAIGYSGMGYATPAVKMLRVSKTTGAQAIAPGIAATLDGSYPIARPLFMYTLGEPAGQVKKYLDWILSEAGQKIVADSGYVPLPERGPATR